MDSEAMKAARKALKLSQGDFARAISRSRSAVAQYEAGQQPIPAPVVKIVEALLGKGGVEVSTVKATKAKPAPAIPPELREAMRRNPPFAKTMAEAKAMRALRAEQKGVTVGHIRLLPLQPDWRRLEGGRSVNAAIPEPIDAAAPAWAGPRGVLTASGAVYDYESAMRMNAPDLMGDVQATAGEW